MLEDDLAIAFVMLVDDDARTGSTHQPGELGLAMFDGLAPQILPIEFDQAKGA